MRILPTLLIALIYCVVTLSAADETDSADIHSQTLFEYVYGTNAPNMECKIRLGIYVDSLESELNRLADSIEVLVSRVEFMPGRFRESHDAFMGSSWMTASFAEEIQWYCLETGEAYWGSGTGYTFAHMIASLYWERILIYRYFIEIASEDVFGEFPTSDGRDIGGDRP